MKIVSVLNYNLFKDDKNGIPLDKKSYIINTLNAYSYIVAKQDKEFKHALQNSDVLLPDGFPLVIAARLLKSEKIKKIAGADIFYYLLTVANERKLKVFFLGSTNETLDKIVIRIKKNYPNIKVNSHSPPFRQTFSDSENEKIREIINLVNPNILFIGMTAPKQEKWAYANKEFINANIICSIGAVFDFYAKTNPRPSDFWIKMNLEWFIRLIKEPKRMWKRYLIYSPLFFKDLLFAKLNNR